MAKKFYLDTSIWRDYYENRSDSQKQLGKLALQFLQKVIGEENIILYSDLVVQELMIKYSKEEISSILSILFNIGLLEKINTSKEQAKEASDLCKKLNIPFGDALHAILARDNKAVMITRDNHFQLLKDIVEIQKPEDLIS